MSRRFLLSIIPLILSLSFSAGLFGQSGIIKGKVIDSKTDEPLIGASVMIEGTTMGVATDLDGNFAIRNVPPGEHTLIASYVACLTDTIEGIKVGANEETTVQILLLPDDISLSEVEVVARANRESENILMMDRQQALVATQSVGVRELSRKGIGDAEAAVTQISGISKQEGVKNVFVRGLGDRYNATLLNGFPVPSEDPEYKNIALEFFGTDIIQNIGVSKAFSGRDYSDVGGALIDISSKELISEYELTFDLSGGFNASGINIDFFRQEGSSYFGFANKTHPTGGNFDFPNSLDPYKVTPLNHGYGLTVGKQFKISGNPLSVYLIGSHSNNFTFTDEIVRDTQPNGVIWKDQTGKKYSQNTNQLLLGTVHFGINKKHDISYHFMMIHSNDQFVGEYSGMNSERFQDVDDLGSLGFIRRQQTNDNILLVNQLITNWSLTDRFKLDLGISYNTISGNEPDRRETYFSKKDLEKDLYNITRSNRNKRFYSELNNWDFNVKTALSYRLSDRFGTENSRISIGYNGRVVDDSFDALEYNTNPRGAIQNFSLVGLDTDKLFRENSEMKTGNSNSYHVKRYIHSAFTELSYQLLSSFSANVGFRVDFVDLAVDYAVEHTNPGEREIVENYYLPGLNLKYDLNSKNALRLGLSKTYTLPQSKEISPYRYVSISFASQGNADLKPSDNYNLDLKWDYYLSPGELFSTTLFYKHIKSPIGRVDMGSSASILSYDNISDKATVAGVELEVKKNIFNRFNTVSETVNRLSVGLNASYIYTDLLFDVTGTEPRHTQLEGASPILVNFDISYHYSKNDRGLIASLILNYFSDRVHTIGALGYKDIVEEGVPSMNFVLSYNFNRHFSAKLNCSNILNDPYRLTRESVGESEKVILDEYKKGQNISLGLSYEF
ncbi:MAG: TonB-dependent receptor domain-containing protein [Fermentimonas sp.]